MSVYKTSDETPQARAAVVRYLGSRGPGEPIHAAITEVMRLTSMRRDVDVREAETYDGWPNRETWAVALYLDNEREWYEAAREVLGALVKAVNDSPLTVDTPAPWVAGSVLRDLVTERLDALDDPASRSDELIGIARDIGSLWRVDWTTLGREYLAQLSE